jgi:hypothetical protein
VVSSHDVRRRLQVLRPRIVLALSVRRMPLWRRRRFGLSVSHAWALAGHQVRERWVASSAHGRLSGPPEAPCRGLPIRSCRCSQTDSDAAPLNRPEIPRRKPPCGPWCSARPLLGGCPYNDLERQPVHCRPNCRPTNPYSGRHQRPSTRFRRHTLPQSPGEALP